LNLLLMNINFCILPMMKLKRTDKRIFFISDVHLSFNEDDKEIEKRKKLYAFLDYVKENGDVLVIGGDLFDFWYEWSHVVPKYWAGILFKLRSIIDLGKRVIFITGNHDFEFGHYLEKEIGMDCFDESCDFSVEDKKFFIGHGDGLAKKDVVYRFMKGIIRNKFSKFLFKTFIHPDLGMKIAKLASGSSRKFVQIDKNLRTNEYYDFSKTKFAEGFDYVILGHLHNPFEKSENGCTYLNTGDWMIYFSYGYYDGESLKLKYWDNNRD